ncbi:MAG: hypothetical protein D6710_03325 [Nitrospirae bacterium]|nr:MAG: hypothetical protein D6710_03325 [Nitrospirota bacterium]
MKVPFRKSLILILGVFIFFTSCVEKQEEFGRGKEPSKETVKVTPIGDIISSPERFRDSIVTLSGTAEPGLAFEFVNEQPYLLKDSTGQIWVITKGIMPKRGESVMVQGAVQSPYQIKGRQYDVVIIEIKRF